jgi:hypothetical protein
MVKVAIINANMMYLCNKRKIETRNVVHLMAATIFIASLNMKY